MKSPGHTFYICYGVSGGLRTEWKKNIKRLVLWRVSIALMHHDAEHLFDQALRVVNAKKIKLAKGQE